MISYFLKRQIDETLALIVTPSLETQGTAL